MAPQPVRVLFTWPQYEAYISVGYGTFTPRYRKGTNEKNIFTLVDLYDYTFISFEFNVLVVYWRTRIDLINRYSLVFESFIASDKTIALISTEI